jgi:hypothetical protein
MQSVSARFLALAAILLSSDALLAQETSAPVTPAPQANTTAATTATTTPPHVDGSTSAKADEQPKKVLHVSTEYIKKLANIGYYPKNSKGQLVFCKKEAPLGTHFVKEVCMDGEQLAMFLERSQAQRDALLPQPCLGPPVCGK